MDKPLSFSSFKYLFLVTGDGTLLHIISCIIRGLRVARNGGQALVTPRDCFLCHVRLQRGVTMLRPRLRAFPNALAKIDAFC